ncbi:hypothetical protein [Streptomyces atratus]|uniref:hypothetical protein n=1 Tax=Streptomyces atratus TaxID=1893 RepID=UPI0022515E98|nr:hypothetical protein [Streptomyces atratus]MCX5339519.1 hypothetical protein [Streptomyces atratus]
MLASTAIGYDCVVAFVVGSCSQLLMSLLAWDVALFAYAAGRALRSGRRGAPDTADIAVE